MLAILHFNDVKFSARNECEEEIELPAVPRIGDKITYRDEPIVDGPSGAKSFQSVVTDVLWAIDGEDKNYAYVLCECEILWD